MVRSAVVSTIAVMLVSAVALSGQSVKSLKTEVTFDKDTKVGATVIKAGMYAFVGEAAQVSFRRMETSVNGDGGYVPSKDKPILVPATRKTLPKKSEASQMLISAGSDGAPVMKGMLIQGSNVQFDFPDR